MAKKFLYATTALIAAVSFAGAAQAGGTTKAERQAQEIQDLKARLEKLEAEQAEDREKSQHTTTRVNSLEDRANDVQWSFDNGRPSVKSGDGRFTAALRGRFHFDTVNYLQDANDHEVATPATSLDLGSGSSFRRAQFGIEGKVFKDFDYEMRFNFGGNGAESAGTINILRVAYTGIPDFRINVGAIQPIFTMDDATSSNDITFLERASVINSFLGAFGGSDARRGVELTYQRENFLFGGDNVILSGAFTGAAIGTAHGPTAPAASSDDEGTQILGRLAYRIYSDADTNIQIGVDAAQVLSLQGKAAKDLRTLSFGDRPEYRMDDTQLVSTGSINADGATLLGFEAGANFRNFYASGEYYSWTVDRQDALLNPAAAKQDPEFNGWYIQASWMLTGEKKPYAAKSGSNSMGVWGAPKVAVPFSLDGNSWGAWELAARYSTVDLNWEEGNPGTAIVAADGRVRGGEQTISTIGVNWYLNNSIRLMFDYSHVDVDRMNAAGAQQGQEFDVIGNRIQFAF